MSVTIGSLITKADIINYYIGNVVNESAGADATVPHSNFPTSLIGPALANPSTTSLEDDVEAVDIVQLLRDHAYNLSRYKKATWVITGNVSPQGTYRTNDLSQLNDTYRDGYSTFDAAAASYGPILEDCLVTASGMTTYILRLRDIYKSLRDATSTITVCHGSCHSSCHSSCHGSRGRR